MINMEYLGTRIRNECAGIHYDSITEHCMPEEILFGVKDQRVLDLCCPTRHFTKWSSRYWTLPSEIRAMISDLNTSTLMKSRDILFFFHYPVDRKRVLKMSKDEDSPIDLFVLKDSERPVSALYGNFLGESLYLGAQPLMQEMADGLKQGFGRALEILPKLSREDMVRSQIGRYSGIRVFDMLKEPKDVTVSR